MHVLLLEEQVEPGTPHVVGGNVVIIPEDIRTVAQQAKRVRHPGRETSPSCLQQKIAEVPVAYAIPAHVELVERKNQSGIMVRDAIEGAEFPCDRIL